MILWNQSGTIGLPNNELYSFSSTVTLQKQQDLGAI